MEHRPAHATACAGRKISQMAKEQERALKVVAQNRRARFNYEIGETFEAGIALTGTRGEIVAPRQGHDRRVVRRCARRRDLAGECQYSRISAGGPLQPSAQATAQASAASPPDQQADGSGRARGYDAGAAASSISTRRAAPSSSSRSRAARSCTTSARPRRSAAGTASAAGCCGQRSDAADRSSALHALGPVEGAFVTGASERACAAGISNNCDGRGRSDFGLIRASRIRECDGARSACRPASAERRFRSC